MASNHRDIHEYHDGCFYCVCTTCEADDCKLAGCQFCEGGKGYSKAKCTKSICTVTKDKQDRYKDRILLF